MRVAIAVAIALMALPAAAQVVATTTRGVVVAHDGVVELFDHNARRLWSAPGVDTPIRIAVSDDRIAILDAWSNRVRIASLSDGAGETLTVAETPIDALFAGRVLYILSRDAATLERIDATGRRSTTRVAADPTYLRQSNDFVYAYSRRDGVLQEIARDGTIQRSAAVGAFASDIEIDGTTAYLVFPHEAKLVAVDLQKMQVRTSVAAGAVPIDIAVVRRGNALSAARLAIADPAAKRLWTAEGAQSVGAAFGRGFLRGLIGLGAFRPRSSEFPTGIDRVVSTGSVTITFDSATGTLYRSTRSGSSPVAQSLSPQAFAVAGERVAVWRAVRLQFFD